MKAKFYDILNGWQLFQPYLTAPEFLRAVRIYKHCCNIPILGPLLNPTISSNDNTYVEQNITDNTSPYWYSAPHECVDLNSIVMSTLLGLALGKSNTELYCLAVVPSNSYDRHMVVSTEYIPKNTVLDLTASDGVILYDLIYPLTNFVGYRWDNRTLPLTQLIVLQCHTVQSTWSYMNYNQYY